jgi:hypothetical protein
MRPQTCQRAVFTRSAAEIGVPGLTPHELRHTAASLAIASGADLKVVQQMLGHKSATTTLDLFGHLFPDPRWTLYRCNGRGATEGAVGQAPNRHLAMLSSCGTAND